MDIDIDIDIEWNGILPTTTRLESGKAGGDGEDNVFRQR